MATSAASQPATVVGLGLCVIDHVFEVDDFRLSATRTRYRDRAVCPGGMVTNALAWAAHRGAPAQLITQVGADSDGRFALRELRRAGVGTRYSRREAAFPTSRVAVLVDRGSGERRFVIADRGRIEREAIDFDLAPIRPGRILLVDGHFASQALRAVQRARQRGARVVADLADARPSNLRLLRHLDYPIVPLEFAESWDVGGPRETLRALFKRCGGGVPVVTLGSRGALVLVEGRFRRIPAKRSRVRDTTGAGDAFHGGFAAGLARGLPLLDAMALAARTASECCARLGGWPAALDDTR